MNLQSPELMMPAATLSLTSVPAPWLGDTDSSITRVSQAGRQLYTKDIS